MALRVDFPKGQSYFEPTCQNKINSTTTHTKQINTSLLRFPLQTTHVQQEAACSSALGEKGWGSVSTPLKQGAGAGSTAEPGFGVTCDDAGTALEAA